MSRPVESKEDYFCGFCQKSYNQNKKEFEKHTHEITEYFFHKNCGKMLNEIVECPICKDVVNISELLELKTNTPEKQIAKVLNLLAVDRIQLLKNWIRGDPIVTESVKDLLGVDIVQILKDKGYIKT